MSLHESFIGETTTSSASLLRANCITRAFLYFSFAVSRKKDFVSYRKLKTVFHVKITNTFGKKDSLFYLKLHNYDNIPQNGVCDCEYHCEKNKCLTTNLTTHSFWRS